MSNNYFVRVIRIGLIGFLGLGAGCDKYSSGPTSPSRSVLPSERVVATNMTVAAISPTTGVSGETVRVTGSGFVSGATVVLGGAAAKVTSITDSVIVATIPVNAAGITDVVVTNRGGQTETLTGAFTYQVVTLTASSNLVTPEGELSVTWEAPGGRSSSDWIMFLNVGSPNTSYVTNWWEYTNGATHGTFKLKAPSRPGNYEFRYLLDDGFNDAARSTTVTVSSAASP